MPLKLSDLPPRFQNQVAEQLHQATKRVEAQVGKRLRQSAQPVKNKLEQDWENFVTPQMMARRSFIFPQAIRFKLANGLWYKVDNVELRPSDFCPHPAPYLIFCHEIKGPHAFRGGFENLKMAAHQYPQFTWLLWWKDAGEWLNQTVLP